MAESSEWPDYEIPTDALADGVDRTEHRSAGETTEVPPSETTEQPPTSATDETGTTGVSKPTDDDPGDVVPRYRLNETQEARRKAEAERETFRAEAATLRRQIEELQRGTRREAPPARATDATGPQTDDEKRTAAVREGMLKIFPELQRLPDLIARLEHAGRWDEAAEATDAWRDAEKTFYEKHTDTQLTRLYDLVAPVMLGKGKTATDLPEMTREAIDNAFGRWVFKDPDRRARYDALDTKLVEEFWPLFKASNIDPLRRSDSAAVLASVAGRPKLPVGGSDTGPAPAVTKKPHANANEDEDAIYETSWGAVQAELAKG